MGDPCPACSGQGYHEIRSKATGGVWVQAKCLSCRGFKVVLQHPLDRSPLKKKKGKK